MKYDLQTLIPHRGKMVLLDGVEEIDLERGTASSYFVVRKEWAQNWAAIEYMAQAAAVLAGAEDNAAHAGAAPRPGLLLGTRRLTLNIDKFKVGARYTVRATNSFRADDAAAFDCVICDAEGNKAAVATLNAYRPPDFKGFLESNT